MIQPNPTLIAWLRHELGHSETEAAAWLQRFGKVVSQTGAVGQPLTDVELKLRLKMAADKIETLRQLGTPQSRELAKIRKFMLTGEQ